MSLPKKERDSAAAVTASFLNRIWKKLGLSGHMLMTMLKYVEFR